MSAHLHTASVQRRGESDAAAHGRRARLMEERDFRIEQLAGLGAQVDADPTLTNDSVWRALRRAARSALEEIEQALIRLDTNRFGRCLSCQRPIPDERLDILPMASLCMSCQYEYEVQRHA